MSVLLCVFVLILVCSTQALQVNTTEGRVEGYKAADGEYYVFYGIPYAGPTEGSNRFKGPVPPAVHAELLRAIDSNVICAQPSQRGLIGIENCLTLSIFTKNVTSPKPVIVWLNSEEYTTSNTAMFSFRRLVEEDIVAVSLNFRLSVFGFLCLGVEEAPGNAGLKDVLAGLRWIKSNIANFGGNPNNIVVMGHAAGGAIVDLLTMSPQSEGLIHKAIALSGSGLAPWAVAYDPIGYAELLAIQLSYDGKTREDLARHLKTTPLDVLNSAMSGISFKNSTPLFAPCIENDNLNHNDTVLSDAPINLLKSGNYLQIPYIAGYTTLEGTMRAYEAAFGNWLQEMQADFSEFLPVDLRLSINRTDVAATVRDFYFSTSPIDISTLDDYLDYYGDTLVVVSAIRGAKERSLTSSAEVRLLKFGYMGTQNSDWTYNTVPLTGVRHGGILNYIFDYDLKTNDEAVMRSIVKRFAAFAHTGTPNVASARTTATWLPITKDQLNYFYYGGNDELTIVNNTSIYVEELRFNPHNLTMNFWNSILAKYYEPPSPTNSSFKLFAGVYIYALAIGFIVLRMF